MICGIGCAKLREFVCMLGPWELAAVDDNAANGVSVAIYVFGGGMHYYIGTIFNWFCHSIGVATVLSTLLGTPAFVCYFGKSFDIYYMFASRVADSFGIYGLWCFCRLAAISLASSVCSKARFYAVIFECFGENVCCAAIKLWSGDYVVASFAQD